MAGLDGNGIVTRCGKAPLGCIADRGCSPACVLTSGGEPLDCRDNRRGSSPRQRFVYSTNNWPTTALRARHSPSWARHRLSRGLVTAPRPVRSASRPNNPPHSTVSDNCQRIAALASPPVQGIPTSHWQSHPLPHWLSPLPPGTPMQPV